MQKPTAFMMTTGRFKKYSTLIERAPRKQRQQRIPKQHVCEVSKLNAFTVPFLISLTTVDMAVLPQIEISASSILKPMYCSALYAAKLRSLWLKSSTSVEGISKEEKHRNTEGINIRSARCLVMFVC
jgi:hypothetical protein